MTDPAAGKNEWLHPGQKWKVTTFCALQKRRRWYRTRARHGGGCRSGRSAWRHCGEARRLSPNVVLSFAGSAYLNAPCSPTDQLRFCSRMSSILVRRTERLTYLTACEIDRRQDVLCNLSTAAQIHCLSRPPKPEARLPWKNGVLRSQRRSLIQSEETCKGQAISDLAIRGPPSRYCPFHSSGYCAEGGAVFGICRSTSHRYRACRVMWSPHAFFYAWSFGKFASLSSHPNRPSDMLLDCT